MQQDLLLDEPSDEEAGHVGPEDLERLTISFTKWEERVSAQHPKLDSAAAAGIARLRARVHDANGDALGSVVFRLHARLHEDRAMVLGQKPRRLADLRVKKASAA